jgi:hypothetical protein
VAWVGTNPWIGNIPWVRDVLPVPPVLTVTDVSPTRKDLSWTAIPDAWAYDVERDGVVIAYGVTGTTYSDTGLPSGATPSYRVRAVN